MIRSVALAGCLACLLLTATPAPAHARGAAGPDPAAVDEAARTAWTATRLPGMALVVTHGAEVVLVKGYGTAGGGRPVTGDTQFRIASLSKSFTATAVLRLADAGRIDLDAPVVRHLPDFAPAGGAAITVRQLLTQTSGLADAGIADDGAGVTTLAERVRSLRTSRTVAAPGTAFHYTDVNYQVLARLVEVVGGQPFADVLRQEVLAPLGMRDTVTTVTAGQAPAAAPRLAQGHVLVFGVPVARRELDGFVAGSGGVVSTADDMARWLVMQSGAGPQVLRPESLRAMHTPPAGIASTYAMGWDSLSPSGGPARLQHFGVLGTFSADQVLLPGSGYGFALLYDGNSGLADTAGVQNAVAAALTGGEPVAPMPRTLFVAVLLGGLTALTLALRGRALADLRDWAARRRSWPRVLPNLVWLVLPAAVLAALPAAILRFAGRRFTWPQLLLSMPDVLVWLGVGAVTGVGLAAARVVALARARRAG